MTSLSRSPTATEHLKTYMSSLFNRLWGKRIPSEDVILNSAVEESTGETLSYSFREIWAEYPGYPLHLSVGEIWWRDRYYLLLRRGYMLLPRYHPDWVGSWRRTYDSDPLGTGCKAAHDLRRYEDAIIRETSDNVEPAMFATRVSDDTQVVIKRVYAPDAGKGEELRIMALLSAPEFQDHPRNHCVRLLGWFAVRDEEEPYLSEDDRAFAVIPLLRVWRQPPFRLAVEALSFIRQILEGLAFLHELNIAHRDITSENILIDPSTMFPSGMNPLINYTMNKIAHPREPPARWDRIDVPVKYLYIDFGESVSFPTFEERRLVLRSQRGHFDFPEMYNVIEDSDGGRTISEHDIETYLYDPFPADIYVLGEVLKESFYTSFPCLRPLVDSMRSAEPADRPTADECVALFEKATSDLGRWQLLRPVANTLHPYYPYQNRWHKPRDIVAHWLDYLRLLVKALVTGRGKSF